MAFLGCGISCRTSTVDTKTLLVGTTGDYRPLSYREPETGAYWGFCLDVAGEIAKAMNVTGKISCSKSRLVGGIAGENTGENTGESTVLTRAGRAGSYGDGMTDVNGTNMTYTDGSVTVSNGSYSGTLTKADTGKEGEIKEQFYALFSAIVTNLASEDNLKIKDIPGNTWGR